jgi:hypothetical protein
MVLTKIKILIAGLAVLISVNAEAKVEQFQEQYEGILNMQNTWDGFYYVDQSTFTNHNSSLSLNYEAIKLLEDQLYIVAGNYSRGGVMTSQPGFFDIGLSFDDPLNPPVILTEPIPIAGTFQYTDLIMMPDGQIETFYSEYGALKGFLYAQDRVSFTIDWTVYSRDRQMLVPEPSSNLLFVVGLMLIGSEISKRHNKKI